MSWIEDRFRKHEQRSGLKSGLESMNNEVVLRADLESINSEVGLKSEFDCRALMSGWKQIEEVIDIS